jgi:hypothetical protein
MDSEGFVVLRQEADPPRGRFHLRLFCADTFSPSSS